MGWDELIGFGDFGGGGTGVEVGKVYDEIITRCRPGAYMRLYAGLGVPRGSVRPKKTTQHSSATPKALG